MLPPAWYARNDAGLVSWDWFPQDCAQRRQNFFVPAEAGMPRASGLHPEPADNDNCNARATATVQRHSRSYSDTSDSRRCSVRENLPVPRAPSARRWKCVATRRSKPAAIRQASTMKRCGSESPGRWHGRPRRCDLRHISGIALALAQLGDARIATWTPDVAGGQFFKHLLHDQLIGQGAQNMAACAQLNDHRLIRGLQSLLGLILVANNLEQLLAARLELILQELAPLLCQRSLQLLRALLVRQHALFEREAPPTRKGQYLLGLLLIGDH